MNLFLKWLHGKERELDEELLLPALERALDRRGITDLAERKALIARAWELHEERNRR